eukprot:scaffold48229_cov27-Tisochrysis_lutea.AAC.2
MRCESCAHHSQGEREQSAITRIVEWSVKHHGSYDGDELGMRAVPLLEASIATSRNVLAIARWPRPTTGNGPSPYF